MLTTTNGRRQRWALPGTFIHPGETLRKAALRALEQKAQIRGLNRCSFTCLIVQAETIAAG